MKKIGSAFLEFDPALSRIGSKKQLRQGLSVSIQTGNSLWVANDETITLERLTFRNKDENGNVFYNDHKQFNLNDLLKLPIPPGPDKKGKMKIEEIDIEGLDCKDGYLWLVGSHSTKRDKLDKLDEQTTEENFKKLRKVTREGNRFLLARIPLVMDDGVLVLRESADDADGKRKAAKLEGGSQGNELTRALEEDKNLREFLNIPGKDNGFDIEGLAVAGDKVFVGLRGPVLRGWAFILEMDLDEKHTARNVLKLKKIRKHALQLDGLGIRDIAIHGSDLLILAGPTMDLDGPVILYRWEGAVDLRHESIVFKGDENLKKVGNIPFGDGDDHAEGIAIFNSGESSQPDSILVVYDASAAIRNFEESGTTADIFEL